MSHFSNIGRFLILCIKEMQPQTSLFFQQEFGKWRTAPARVNGNGPLHVTQVKKRNQEREMEKLQVDVRERSHRFPQEALVSQDSSPKDRNVVVVKQQRTPATFPVVRSSVAGAQRDQAANIRQHLTFSDTDEASIIYSIDMYIQCFYLFLIY